jgi:hypothetical protein
MRKTPVFFRAVACAVMLSNSVAALAEPVTDADLRGKKICWNNGGTSFYGKDGSFEGARFGHGTWSLVGDRLTVNAEHGSGASSITKDNATFHTVSSGRHGKSFEAWGKYCN